ncbi:alpha/beta hydrolase [Bacillus piscicola]|uniref:alpha/beta hydrolase n=1 Tax=Bacillus piscicola TaxID=1632684 RepID=UPI001F0893A6|nr:alpha/beta hydrolase [Bacillus piscicola]
MITSYIEKYNLPADIAYHEWFTLPFGKDHIFMQVFTPEDAKKTVLFVHGFFDHTGTNSEWLRFLVANGYRVAVFDLPGHGYSGGKRFSVDGFEKYQKAVQLVLQKLSERYVNRVHMIGHSTGAAIIADCLLTNQDERLEKICLLSPLLRSSKWLLSKCLVPMVTPFMKQIPRSFKTGSPLAKRLQQDPLQGKTISLEWVQALFKWEKELKAKLPSNKQVLIVQGIKDQTVDWKYNLQTYSALFPQAKTIMIDGGSHQLLNETHALKDMVYHLTLRFISGSTLNKEEI